MVSSPSLPPSKPFIPSIKKPAGTDLSQGGVLVGSLEYAQMMKQLQEKVASKPVYLDPSLVPIYSDSDSISSGDGVDAKQYVMSESETGVKNHHIRASKLTSFLRSLLNVQDDQSSGEQFVDEVVRHVMENRHASEMDLVCPVPLFLLRTMIQSAAQQPSLVPDLKTSPSAGKVLVINGKEVVRISDHPQLKAYFDRLAAGEEKAVIQKDMTNEGLNPSALDKDPNDVVLLEDYDVSFLPSNSVRPEQLNQQGSGLRGPAVEAAPNQVPRSKHPQFSKYFHMLQCSIPKEKVIECMVKDGVDPALLDHPDDLLPLSPMTPPVSPVARPSAPAVSPISISDSAVGEASTGKATMKSVALKDHPAYAKYFKMLKMGLPKASVIHKMRGDGVDETIIDRDPEELVEVESKDEESRSEEPSKSEAKKIALKDHPAYAKYFKMLKMGLPKASVIHKMKGDGVDETIIDRDPNELIEVESKDEESKSEEAKSEGPKKIALKDHPAYAKYFKMLKMGLPKASVIHKMKGDGVDETIIDRDPEELVEVESKDEESRSEEPSKSEAKKIALKDHPAYAKYFKMLKMGLPKASIVHKMKGDGVDVSIIDRDPEEMVELEESKSELKKVALKDHPVYAKYFKMLKMGLPKASIVHKMRGDGIDVSIIDRDPEELVELEESKSEPKKIALKDHPAYAKYFKMLKMGLPKASIVHKMRGDGVDVSIIDRDPEEMVELEESKSEPKKVALKDHPAYAKYFKMLKMGLPKASIVHKMKGDGVDVSIIDRDPEEMVELEGPKDGSKKPATAPGAVSAKQPPRIRKVPLREHPDFEKYFTMLERGLPRIQVERVMRKDKKDVSILDHDPNELMEVKASVLVK